MAIPPFPPPPPLGPSTRIARRIALTVVGVQAAAAFAASAAAVLYVGLAGSSSNQSPLAGLAVVIGLAALGMGVVVGGILVWAARRLRADARGSVASVATAEAFVIFLGLWGGSVVGLAAIATGAAVLFCLSVIRSDQPRTAPGP